MHPTLWIEPVTATMPSGDNGYQTFEIDFEVRVFDLVNKDETNENDVLSDTIDVLKDIIIQFKEHPFYVESQIDIINDISFESFTEEFDEEVSGWLCEISLMTPVLTTYCGIASEPIPEPDPPIILDKILDIYPGSSAGYSLRKLSNSYLGSAIQVRRDSDGSTLEIGFAGEELDTDSLISFCSGTSGFVSKWYDQSGNGNDAEQVTSFNQSKIYDSVTGVVMENGKPALIFNGSSTFLDIGDGTFGNISDNISTFTTIKSESLTTNLSFILSKSYNGDGSYAIGLRNNFGRVELWVDTTKYLSPYLIDNRGFQFLMTNINLEGVDGLKVYTDSSLDYESTYQGTISGTNTYIYSIGRSNQDASYYWKGTMQEIILYPTDETTNRIGIETNTNDFYTIY